MFVHLLLIFRILFFTKKKEHFPHVIWTNCMPSMQWAENWWGRGFRIGGIKLLLKMDEDHVALINDESEDYADWMRLTLERMYVVISVNSWHSLENLRNYHWNETTILGRECLCVVGFICNQNKSTRKYCDFWFALPKFRGTFILFCPI